MKKKERPEIELYMYSMNQEFPVEKGHSTFLKRHSEVMQDVTGKLMCKEEVAGHTYKEKLRETVSDWLAQWIHNKWIQDYTKSPSWSSGVKFGPDRLKHLVMRKEDFGGIVLDPTYDRVYKVNTAGYVLLEEIIEAFSRGRLKKFSSKKFKNEDIEHFIYFVKGAGLWPI